MMALKRIFKYYGLEIILAIVMFYIAVNFSQMSEELISALARKSFLWSAGLVAYYIARIIKIGTVEWNDEWQKIYAIAILLYTGLVFSFG